MRAWRPEGSVGTWGALASTREQRIRERNQMKGVTPHQGRVHEASFRNPSEMKLE